MVDKKVIQESKCYGLAYDGTVKECNICEIAKDCKLETSKYVASVTKEVKATAGIEESPKNSTKTKPEEKPASTKAKTKAKEAPEEVEEKTAEKTVKDTSAEPAEFATFKAMSLEELGKFAKKRGVENKWADKDDRIHRLQLTIAIKKSYK